MGLKLNKFANPIIHWLNREKPAADIPLCDFERIRYELKPCDVLLVEGRSRVSDVIKLITQSPWSHAALYIGRIHDIEDPAIRENVATHYQGWSEDHLIIESQLGTGTVIRPLSVYKNDHLRICRPTGLTYKDGQEVIRYGVNHLGFDYDVRQIFDLFRFLFPWFIMPRQYRSTLFRHNAGRTTKTVCSTMIAQAFGSIQFPILPLVKKTGAKGVQLFRQNPKLCTPSDFDYSPYFEIIKYPFIDFKHQANYRLMPWSGTGKLTDEELKFHDLPNFGTFGQIEKQNNEKVREQETNLEETPDSSLPGVSSNSPFH